MEVTFRKAAHRRDFPPWIATKGKTRIVGSHQGSDARELPHDIVTLVVERELRLSDGFFGTVAAGGTFRSMRKRRHAAGKAAIAARRSGLAAAERLVDHEWGAWKLGHPTPCRAALDAALAGWRAVPRGGVLTLTWDVPQRRA